MGQRDTRKETQALIAACDLKIKLKVKSKTLSGGQKRKLQLAMMFAGGSAVCCVDEVSSGLDPLSRRKIWDILLAERGDRTIIMTTHFLDEADFLADNIAILSKGILKAEGSCAELKHCLGNGYKVHVPAQGFTLLPNFNGVTISESANETDYSVPDPAEAARLIEYLERNGISNYRVSGPTIEELFLKLASDDSPIAPAQVSGKSKIAQEAHPDESFDIPSATGACNLQDCKRISALKQSWIIFQKRFTVLRRSYMPYVSAVIVGIIGAGVTPLLMKDYVRLECPHVPDQASSYDQYSFELSSLATRASPSFVMGPRSKISQETLQRIASLYTPQYNEYGYSAISDNSTLFQITNFVDTMDEFNAYITQNRSDLPIGGIFLPDSGPPVMAWTWSSNLGSTDSIILQNILDMISLDTDIVTSFTTFPPLLGVVRLYDFAALLFCIYFGLVSACYPALFAIYPTNERIRQSRAMQYSNGVRSMPLWLAYITFDFLWVLVISIVSTILLGVATSALFALPYIFLILVLYGIASILLSYVISMFAPSALAAWSFSAGGQAIIYFAFFGGLIGIQANVDAIQLDSAVDTLSFTIGLISPIANLLRALLVALGQFRLTCRGETYPAAITLYGGPILYLILQSLVLFAILLLWDGDISPLSYFRKRSAAARPHTDEAKVASIEGEFVAKLLRVEAASAGLRVQHLTKTFSRKKFTAVDDVTFSVQPGEIFALLGPNGAGKSTVISLVRGDIHPSTPGIEHSGRSILHADPTRSGTLPSGRLPTVRCNRYPHRDGIPDLLRPHPRRSRPGLQRLWSDHGLRTAALGRTSRAQTLRRHEAQTIARHRTRRQPKRPPTRRALFRPGRQIQTTDVVHLTSRRPQSGRGTHHAQHGRGRRARRPRGHHVAPHAGARHRRGAQKEDRGRLPRAAGRCFGAAYFPGRDRRS